jgi:hypothetical protein
VRRHLLIILLDEARIDVVVGNRRSKKKRKVFIILFFSFSGEKGTPSLCVNTVKNFSMITRLVSEETVQFIMKKTNDELL